MPAAATSRMCSRVELPLLSRIRLGPCRRAIFKGEVSVVLRVGRGRICNQQRHKRNGFRGCMLRRPMQEGRRESCQSPEFDSYARKVLAVLRAHFQKVSAPRTPISRLATP